MKAFHQDCHTPLENGYCPVCCFFVDMQSVYLKDNDKEVPQPSSESKIYTRKGDDGNTSIRGGAKRSKNDLQIHVLGDLDELNCALGICRVNLPGSHTCGFNKAKVEGVLLHLQHSIFQISAYLAYAANGSEVLHDLNVHMIEQHIDVFNSELPELKNFLYPGGTSTAANFYMARAVARRAERSIISFLNQQKFISEKSIKSWMNRISDLLFVLARYTSQNQEEPWLSK